MAEVPNFSVSGFEHTASNPKTLQSAHAQMPRLHALNLSACVGARYDSATNKICFTVPIYGDACITAPMSIPLDAGLKACIQTCGALIPTGVKVTIYLNDNAVWNGVVFGSC
ncbi:hypothetical protein EST62_12985 [Chlorobaculum sp. 24CR]|uniref:hypothetical protein n=1 Tax=Chlorobaculum sp. 24CR TaxID=2508878 RepID=UPI00100C1E79|nr:hypothetical protein [Chlorobaculum sp. 24CR]RXK80016.1 hypothetical protein EST62_12985 [Chlorobaculum sp. 24CR]